MIKNVFSQNPFHAFRRQSLVECSPTEQIPYSNFESVIKVCTHSILFTLFVGRVLYLTDKSIVVSMERFGLIYVLPWDDEGLLAPPKEYRDFYAVAEHTDWTCPAADCRQFHESMMLFCSACGELARND